MTVTLWESLDTMERSRIAAGARGARPRTGRRDRDEPYEYEVGLHTASASARDSARRVAPNTLRASAPG